MTVARGARLCYLVQESRIAARNLSSNVTDPQLHSTRNGQAIVIMTFSGFSCIIDDVIVNDHKIPMQLLSNVNCPVRICDLKTYVAFINSPPDMTRASTSYFEYMLSAYMDLESRTLN